MAFGAKLNQLLFQKLGLTLHTEGSALHFRQMSFAKVSIQRPEKTLVILEQVTVHPEWKLALKLSGSFEFVKLTWDRFCIEQGHGTFVLERKHFTVKAEGLWQGEAVQMEFHATWHKEEHNAHVELGARLASATYSPIKHFAKETVLKLEAPFALQLRAFFPPNYFRQPDFRRLSWEGVLEAQALAFDVAYFPQVRVQTHKQENHPGFLKLLSEAPAGLLGELTLDRPQEFQLSGELRTQQPLLSKAAAKYLELHDLDEISTLHLQIAAMGRTGSQLLQQAELRGSFQITPRVLGQFHYEAFEGEAFLSIHEVMVKVPQLRLNGGLLRLLYQQHFKADWELSLEGEEVESQGLIELFLPEYGLRGKASGRLVFGENTATQTAYQHYEIQVQEGEILRQRELLARFELWKELQEVRKQLLHWEGFQTLKLKLHVQNQDSLLELVEMEGHLQQKLRLSGTVKKSGRLNLLLETYFVGLATLVFTIKGPASTPVILPAPAKMAEHFVKGSHKALKGFFNTLKDLTQ